MSLTPWRTYYQAMSKHAGSSPGAWEVTVDRRFLDDFKQLDKVTAEKVEMRLDLLHEHGPRYPAFHTRRVKSHPDDRFHFMNVDDSFRMLVALEGSNVHLVKVGAHDQLEEAALRTDVAELEKLALEDAGLAARSRKPGSREGALFEQRPSLKETVRSPAVTDRVTAVDKKVLEGWHDGTIEEWMVFLSPLQRRAVDRAVAGPSRVTGGPGTGKTVVGLHRAAAFAAKAEGRSSVLMTSYVKTVVGVLEGLFERLAPELQDRVEFRNIHKLARRALAGRELQPDDEKAKEVFEECLESDRQRRDSLLQSQRLPKEYLWEEVTRVIEGRGVEDLESYLRLERHGRKRPLDRTVRSRIWSLYEDYLEACESEDLPVTDSDRLLVLALDAVRNDPPSRNYSAIVVDEAQDLTEVGLRFLLEHLEGREEGRLMLIGDMAQRIYPGGYRLADLGLEVRGRSFVLDVCYRSTDEIMKAVGALGKSISTEEFGADGVRGLSPSTVRQGPRPRLHVFDTEEDEVEWILETISRLPAKGRDGTAILCYSNKQVKTWLERLEKAPVPAVSLEKYSGRPVPGVKVGTYNRAKGLEFERVFLPHLRHQFPWVETGDPDQVIMHLCKLYVAMARARDVLELSCWGSPTHFLDDVVSFVDYVDH